jgi:hypothetical protein
MLRNRGRGGAACRDRMESAAHLGLCNLSGCTAVLRDTEMRTVTTLRVKPMRSVTLAAHVGATFLALRSGWNPCASNHRRLGPTVRKWNGPSLIRSR